MSLLHGSTLLMHFSHTERFFAKARRKTQKYTLYFEALQRSIGGKDPA